MRKVTSIVLSGLIFAVLSLGTFDQGPNSARAALKPKPSSEATAQAAFVNKGPSKMYRPTLADLKAAAARAKAAREAVSGGANRAMLAPAPGGTPDYYGIYSNYANSPLPVITRDPVSGAITAITGGMRKFVDSLPGIGPAGANNLGQYIPVATPDTTTYSGSDYYEIALVEYREQMHSDLPATGVRLRGYVQEIDGVPVDSPHYLGPLIVAQKNRPVRVKFTNRLPTGAGGDLFIPVDTTLMGAGTGPNGGTELYTQNRATIHLHGGNTPWISDGTPHQWITPAGESTSYPKGVSVRNVPDMPDPGPGAMTFFYSNQQSARLMFYHDHAFGITRLNVYAGEAAGYLLQDPVELGLISSGIIPADQIPLVIQDRTFVPDNTQPFSNLLGSFGSQLEAQDPTWDTTKWGGFGDLWYPHVYMPYQNPADISGTSAIGRWHYSAWFWPPYIPMNPPVANPYYDPINAPWEPPMIPGTPNPSVVAEAFMDTPIVNGTAYPYLELQPKAYRFRILNAANDRFLNLQFYLADPAVTTVDGRANTEVKMVPAVPTAGFPEEWPTDGRIGGVPDPATQGPPFIQIGTEGGFLPAPVVISAQPVDWNRDMGTFDFSNVDTYSLFLGTAERADVIVDFSQFAGKTLILYNDSPAPVPAGDPRLDYFTDAPDQTDVGGAPSTPAGWGPNTRTIMQIRVAAGVPAAPFNLTALQNAFATTGATPGVFAAGQNQIIVPGDSYNSAYNMTFPPDPYVRIGDNTLTFTPIGATAPVTLGLEPKAIQDEMGEAFDPEYGRMSGKLGLEMPRTVAGAQNFMLYDYTHPPVELIVPSLYGTPIGVLGDGTQIWKITQNGVDTHAMHFHVFEVQLINRVAWDNNIRLPDPNELGWKDTVRVNPLQDTIVALRPIAPILPFQIPNSIRPLAPNEPLGAVLTTGLATFDPSGEPVTIINHLVNFGWEYVWHCHLLAHEENDMMHGIAVGIAPPAPTNLQAVPTTLAVRLTWTDNSLNETGFTIQRAGDAGFTTGLMTFTVGENVTTYLDYSVIGFSTYYYRVMANNVIGDTAVYSAPSIGFPHVSVDSGFTNVAAATTSNIWPFGPDFNGDGQGDILWRYYGAGGSNLVWYIGVTGGALASSQSSLMNKPGGAIQAIDMPLASVPQKILLDPREAGGMFKESALRREFRDAREAGRLLTRTKRESVEMKLPAGERVLTDPREIAGEGRMQTQALTLLGQDMLPAVTNTNWEIAGTGDFNNDGNADILWRYYGPEGYNVIWYMNGVNYIGQDMLYAVTNTNWRIAGTGDFNNDGNTDILWRYYGPEGFNAVWYMNGANYIGQDVIMAVTNPSWKIVGTGDFNSDGSPDILWRYSGPEGFNVVWYMNGVNYIGQDMLYAVTNTNWEIAGTGDFNNDGNTDIIWRYYGPEGFNVVWYMNGATYIGQEMLPAETDLNWRIENN